ncbi:hypothetical protein THER_1662 [Thermodesulfovibrio sp. N1]|uniref:hypothetical protein n=1 Tax=unclassified Thermodesulfovibrio TaxID=2645936 RepID=UPI00083AFB62|nr:MULTISPECIES: hypothetical protein [unclassified Thermodesulfovibrio]MDI1471913.1 hypothetical protein [Thermodesulfovibrio sp. 1176]ODA43623.1 hypothetical protein THER_1662 [Thermodesulfovibrio sp. N1]
MLTLVYDKELFDLFREYSKKFGIELIAEETLKKIEEVGIFHIIDLPDLDYDVIKKEIQKCINNIANPYIDDIDFFFTLAGWTKEKIEEIRRGDILF